MGVANTSNYFETFLEYYGTSFIPVSQNRYYRPKKRYNLKWNDAATLMLPSSEKKKFKEVPQTPSYRHADEER